MAVEVRYHVIRDGEEVAVYLTKKEADEHDKMLDIAFALSEFISRAPQVALDEDALEELTIYLAENRAEVIRILRALKPKKPAASKPEALAAPKSTPAKPGKTPAPAAPKTKAKAKGKGKSAGRRKKK